MLIKVNVSTDIFESPKVKRQFDDIFEETKFLFLNRYEEMISVIAGGKNKKEYKSVISFEDVFKKFKEKFLEKVAALGVQTSFSCKNHNIKSNLISALTTENITKAITVASLFNDTPTLNFTNKGIFISIKESDFSYKISDEVCTNEVSYKIPIALFKKITTSNSDTITISYGNTDMIKCEEDTVQVVYAVEVG